MHEPVVEGLEAYLAGRPDAEFIRHLDFCPACRECVRELTEQSRLLRSLRPPDGLEPAPGFYGRVIDRIQLQKSASIWSVFLEPLFARRLMYASAVATLLLGIFLFTSPKDENMASSMPEQILAEDDAPPPAQLVDLEQDRNMVFVQLTTYQE
ncbi:MAG: hypothetical protein HY235_14800 [Acidobacteria bacterium]|nr:hypothetical protein [Acidobacteriota bacterium]